MKKLFTILWILLSSLVGVSITFAEEIPVTINPSQQYAIIWSILDFNVSTSGVVTQDSKIQITLPDNLKFLSASVPPRNLLQISLGEQPYWLISSGSSFDIVLSVKEMSQEFSDATILAQLINWDEWIATWIVSPIADIKVEKIITSPNPKWTWDSVSFDIVIKNIGSKLAESVKIVDIWPSNILNFANFWILDWNQVVPYIYNWNANQYEFAIWDIRPWEESLLSVSWTMNTQYPVGTEFTNTAFAIVLGDQFSTWNDSDAATWLVSWYPNVYITAQKLNQDPSINGDPMSFSITYGNNWQEAVNTGKIIIYLPSIMNQNNVSVSLEWWVQEWNMYTRELNWLPVGFQNTITISWEMMTSSPVWTQYSLNGRIYAIWQEETTWSDNDVILTWIIQSFFLWDLSATIQNMTRPNMNVNDTQIQAISWDEAKISIVLVNSGNIIQTWFLRVTNGSEIWFFEEVSLIPWKATVFTVNRVIWPKWYQSMTPEIKFTYGDNQNIIKSVQINEPLQCGDWFITQNEACDTASTEWLLPGQHCSDNCMSIITDNIVNTACIEYSSEWWNWQLCDDATIYIGEQDYLCKSITSSGNVVQIDDEWKWSMRFTCETSDWLIADSIVIDCGNWQIWSRQNSRTFSYTCNYTYDDDWDNDYTATCTINNQTPTNPSCEKDIMVWYGFYWNCGNGIIEPGEDCDLWNTSTLIWKPKTIWYYLDFYQTVDTPSNMVNNWYSCKNCKIIHDGNFVYEPAECLQTDTPISVMDNEIMPFWWRIWIKDTQIIEDDNYACNTILYSDSYNKSSSKTILKKDSMICSFAVYNWKTYTQWNDSNPAFHFKTKCFNNYFNTLPIYEYFKWTHQTKANWASIATVNTLLGWLRHINEYWEYKLVLEEVEYQYCNTNNGSWQTWQRYGAVCEVNFAVTRPYTMQISTLWVNPVATNGNEFLNDFWDMKWKRLLTNTDLSDVINTDDTSYEVTTNAQEKINAFKEKYEKLAITIERTFKINGKTIESMFGNNVTVMKVPNQHIYFIKWDGTLTLSQDRIWITSAYTIFVDGMDVEIEWNVLQYAMIITTETMKFKDKEEWTDARCITGWQVVQWLFVALRGFVPWEPMRNTDVDEQWCAWWWLHVKWVLIGDWLEDLMNSRRSQLNQWFTSNPGTENVLITRRKYIIWWAAVLIEYNPSLWKTLPPWAEIFTESLEVYRK